jgi:methyltransferase FkbM-like protein
LKMDVQGAEKNILRGGKNTLKNTAVIITEADIEDFQEINQYLV